MKGELKKLALQETCQKGKKRSTRGREKRGKPANITLIDEKPEEVNAHCSRPQGRRSDHGERPYVSLKRHYGAANAIYAD